MQDIILLAFRKRLKKRGYTQVSIKRKKDIFDDDVYVVTAREPLAGKFIKAEYSLLQFHSLMR